MPRAEPFRFDAKGGTLAGIGTWGLAISMINGAAVTDMSTENFGVGTAVLQTARQTGGILGVALFFGFYGTPAPDEIVDTFQRLWLAFAILSTFGFLLAFRLPAATGRLAQNFKLTAEFLVTQGRAKSVPDPARIARHIDPSFWDKAQAGGCE